ncbi:PIG-X [Zychaea mexicana]|uniref:PIG-X n=1 Tax=Zychaea mexicana TaxID=64656 RepID=UPI0022FEF3AF|nr:PIG-X [Zychaea mexicana]KAI9490524.1 PIG-X [Zychaea mexicana]
MDDNDSPPPPLQVQWSLDKAESLHPHIITTLHSVHDQQQPKECWLDLIYQLPASVFVDPNQLPSNVHVFGETDLEAPLEHVQEPRGSTVIIRHTNNDTNDNDELRIDLPIHLRYQRPSSTSQIYRSIAIPKPRVGWTCAAKKKNNNADLDTGVVNDSVTKSNNRRRRAMPPIRGTLIPAHRMDPDLYTFQDIHIQPQDASSSLAGGDGNSEMPLYLELKMPVGRAQDADMVQMGTMVAVLACTFWIILATWKSIAKRRRYDAKGKRRRSE